MMYNKSHTNPMGWEEFASIVNKLILEIDEYQRKQGIVFDTVSPIMRSGAIPAIMIANKLKIIPMSPLQVKYCKNEQTVISSPVIPKGIDVNSSLNILVVESNTSTGESAKNALSLLKETYPNAKLHYVSVAKVFGAGEEIEGCESCHFGVLTNEMFCLSEEEAEEKGVRSGITIFPWETAQYELDDING